MKPYNLFIEKGAPVGEANCLHVVISSHDRKDGLDGFVARVFGQDEAAAEMLAREILDRMSVTSGGESGLLEVNEYQLMGGGPDDVGHLRIQRKRLPGDVTKWVLVGIGCALSDSGEWVERPYLDDIFPLFTEWDKRCLFDTPDAALRCWQTAVMRNVHDDGDSQEGKPDDLAFLKEIQERLTAGVDGGDPTQIEYAREMIRDWVDELEEVEKADKPTEDRPDEATVRDILRLVERDVPLEYLQGLNDADLDSVLLWASSVHLAANDNDVEVPPMPLWLANYLPDTAD